jgi:hypothetical protein
MKKISIILVIALILFTLQACKAQDHGNCDPTGIKTNKATPSELGYSNYPDDPVMTKSDSIVVKLENNVLTYKIREEIGQKQISDDEWKKFRQELDRLNVWNWKNDYSDRTIADGNHIGFWAKYSDKCVETGGSNGNPPNFDSVIKALEQLLGKKL